MSVHTHSNFANTIYCAVNVHFRRIVREMVTCRPWWRWTVPARPTTIVAATYVERTPGRCTHLTTVESATKTSNLRLSARSPDCDQFDISDADELNIE